MTVNLPAKPKRGAPCNGCGLCCAREICGIGEIVHGEAQQPPCPSLKIAPNGERTYCELMEIEEFLGGEQVIHKVLGVGTGCYMEDA